MSQKRSVRHCRHVLRTFTNLYGATLKAVLGRMRPMGHRLDKPGLERKLPKSCDPNSVLGLHGDLARNIPELIPMELRWTLITCPEKHITLNPFRFSLTSSNGLFPVFFVFFPFGVQFLAMSPVLFFKGISSSPSIQIYFFAGMPSWVPQKEQ